MRHAMDRLGEEKQSKKDKPARGKPKYPDLTQPSEFRGVKPTDKEQLNTNRNKFYGYEGAGPSIDVNKLYQASKNTAQPKGPGVSKDLQNNHKFKHNTKQFYAQSTASRGDLDDVRQAFYADAYDKPADPPVNKHS